MQLDENSCEFARDTTHKTERNRTKIRTNSRGEIHWTGTKEHVLRKLQTFRTEMPRGKPNWRKNRCCFRFIYLTCRCDAIVDNIIAISIAVTTAIDSCAPQDQTHPHHNLQQLNPYEERAPIRRHYIGHYPSTRPNNLIYKIKLIPHSARTININSTELAGMCASCYQNSSQEATITISSTFQRPLSR